MKSILTVSVDSDILRKVKDIPKFNISAFVESKLKELVIDA